MQPTALAVGFSPITFNNEDLRDLRAPIPYRDVLDRIAKLGYAGTERGAYFPEDPAELARELADRQLQLVGGWCGLDLTGKGTRESDLAHVRSTVEYLAHAGARYVNLAHAGTPERRAWAGRAGDPSAPRLTPDGWSELADRVNAAAAICAEEGLEATFHPHAGTWVETRAEIDRLLELTDPVFVSLCFDVGHALYGGMDPYATLRDHSARIRYVHVKDVSRERLAQARSEKWTFEDAIRKSVFTELSRGLLDLRALADALTDVSYPGWLMVEQDTSERPPDEAARIARDALAAAGLWRREDI